MDEMGRERNYVLLKAAPFRGISLDIQAAELTRWPVGPPGIRKAMEFWPLRDEESGIELCGIGCQEAGTGDVYASVAILFGTGVGNQGGAPGTMTDNAGCRVLRQ